ncbi:MAG: hypothetical protein JXB07_00980 [Anaerolineae bacterium]|nr:hypothetical protein [Anaerolineae bacterium]
MNHTEANPYSLQKLQQCVLLILTGGVSAAAAVCVAKYTNNLECLMPFLNFPSTIL